LEDTFLVAVNPVNDPPSVTLAKTSVTTLGGTGPRSLPGCSTTARSNLALLT
jgi:hypothetical protein